MKISKILLAAAAVTAMSASAKEVELVVKANKPGAEIQPTMYGLFFEDINYAGDGGLYAEMVKNRSFEFPQTLMGWQSTGGVTVLDDGPFERNPHYVRLTTTGHRDIHTGLVNEGFFGVAFEKDKEYRFSVWARGTEGNTKIAVELADPASMGATQVMASAKIDVTSNEWTKYQVILKPKQTVAKGVLRIFLESSKPCDLEHVSLFPVDTWQGHENGLRRDLAQKLNDINPGLLRFPGGCIVEGTIPATRYQWKNTVGPVENRPLNENRWIGTFRSRYYPDYYQSGGLGFYEYFQLAEEIGAEPLPVVNCGLVCQYQNKLDQQIPLDSLQQYIDDAIDLIEFANGGTDTQWGKLRADMGHPEPFNLKYLGVGNEQWGPEYVERLEPFVKALRAKHPEIKIVGTSGPDSEGSKFDYLWPEMKRLKVDLVDEHFYRPETFFLSQATRYDNYDRKGPKVFAGEYACHGKGKKYNHFNASLLEAAFMTGLERNADIVHMATYAPLFAHVEGWQWRPDMIWFDNLRSVPSASYYVQQLYGTNKGERVLPLTLNGAAVTGAEGQDGLYATAATGKETGSYIVKIVNTSDKAQDIAVRFDGLKKNVSLTTATATTLHADDPDSDNTLDNQSVVVPVQTTLTPEGNVLKLTIPAKTFGVYNIK